MLRTRILSGDLDPGTQHSVYRLAAEFGVSRTPVREAVLRLADAGLVTIEKNRGITINGPTLRDIREIFEFRLVLEVPAASYAASHSDKALVTRLRAELDGAHRASAEENPALAEAHDREFHQIIVETLGNPRMTKALGSLRDAARLGWAVADDWTQLDRERAAIFDAIVRGDSRAAAVEMESHILRTGTLHQQRLLEHPQDMGWQRRLHEHVRVGTTDGTGSASERETPREG